MQLELELEGALDGALLEAAVQAVVERHASLRAAFRHEQLSRPVQVIVPRVGGAVAAASTCRSCDADEQRAAAGGDAAADRLERFDLARRR